MIVPKRAKILLQNAAKFYEPLYFFLGGGGGQEVEKSVKEKQAKSGEKTTFSRSPFVWLVPSN